MIFFFHIVPKYKSFLSNNEINIDEFFFFGCE